MTKNLFKPLKEHKLKALLKVNNVRQAQAAQKLGVSLGYFSMCLNGHTKPTKKLEEGMTQLVFQLSPEELLTKEQKERYGDDLPWVDPKDIRDNSDKEYMGEHPNGK